jgi:hypothetical protein
MAKYLTKEKAQELLALRRKLGRMGGRPKGVLSKTTIAKIKTKETFAKEVAKKAGVIAEGLFQNLIYNQDSSAGKELLERAFGKVPQGVNIQAVQFSLKELSEYRKNLQQGDQHGLPELPKPEEVK